MGEAGKDSLEDSLQDSVVRVALVEGLDLGDYYR